MNLKHTLVSLAAASAMAMALACGGSTSSAPAAPVTPPVTPAALKLVYTDAAAGAVQLVGNAGLSTGSHLVIDIVGTSADALGSGLSMTLNADPAVAKWAKVQAADGALVQNGSVIVLGDGVAILKAKAVNGTLTFAVSQKGILSPVPLTGVLARVALDLQPGVSAGQVVFNAPAGGSKLLLDPGVVTDITPTVGTLVVK